MGGQVECRCCDEAYTVSERGHASQRQIIRPLLATGFLATRSHRDERLNPGLCNGTDRGSRREGGPALPAEILPGEPAEYECFYCPACGYDWLEAAIDLGRAGARIELLSFALLSEEMHTMQSRIETSASTWEDTVVDIVYLRAGKEVTYKAWYASLIRQRKVYQEISTQPTTSNSRNGSVQGPDLYANGCAREHADLQLGSAFSGRSQSWDDQTIQNGVLAELRARIESLHR